MVKQYIRLYNEESLHSALGYIAPMDELNGREQAIFAAREEKLKKSRQQRAQRWAKVA